MPGYSDLMCRNIKTLFNFEPAATDDEIRAASLQFVRKLSGFTKPSKANEAAFDQAIDEVAVVDLISGWPVDRVRTLYEGIRRPLPATAIRVDSGSAREAMYWRPLLTRQKATRRPQPPRSTPRSAGSEPL